MNYIFKSIMMTLVLALVPFMGISAKKKAVQQSDRIFYYFFNTGASFSQEIGTHKCLLSLKCFGFHISAMNT